jgi:hypothetical protein
MHPVEHLYYYACILPNLALLCSPFHFLWNGVHLLLAPGASHSGFEDHFQADNFHYMFAPHTSCSSHLSHASGTTATTSATTRASAPDSSTFCSTLTKPSSKRSKLHVSRFQNHRSTLTLPFESPQRQKRGPSRRKGAAQRPPRAQACALHLYLHRMWRDVLCKRNTLGPVEGRCIVTPSGIR